ncbi:hypothetical protein FH972_003071 [Carpinus fangiana]|uniref:Serine aminopeptidase S33 domain-containing protein n=1 Tax=Carpinus fangiana TaxID=176857 RepID=A0A5N6QJH6_9ROSI|nr:hypothetical protein FH972_003071 [Carpinus fangiana]
MESLVCGRHAVLPNSLFLRKPHSTRFSFNRVRMISSGNDLSRRTLRMALQPTQNPVVQQKVIIPNKYGEKLVGVLHETESSEVVILCHGFRSTKENTIVVNLAVALEKEGISAFRFDFAGNGWLQILSFQLVRFLAGFINYKRGCVVLLYASKYHDIYMVVNVSGRYYLTEGIIDHLGTDFMQRIKEDGFIDVKNEIGSVDYRVTEESLMDRLSTNMHEACLQIDKECRVLTVHGSHDWFIPLEDAIEFDKKIPNHHLHIIGGSDHTYNHYHRYLATVVLDFMKATPEQNKDTTS